MKKVIFLVYMFVFSTLFCSEVADVMRVSARVLESITLRVDKHVEFGDVIKGQSYEEKGEVSIKSQIGEGVSITYDGIEANGNLPMLGADGITVMTARASHPTTWHVAQSDGFESIQPITVWLDVPNNIKSQTYKADITIRARYN